MPTTYPAYTIGGITRPALIVDDTGHIVLFGASAAFAATYGIKALYLGLPPGFPVLPPVTDSVSPPVDSNGAGNTVAEGAAANTAVGITASATSIIGNPVTYSLVGDTSGGGFKINATTGVVTVNDPTKINFETATHNYSITVQANDGIVTSTQTFVIGVSDVAPSTPVDSNGAANTVAEGAAANTTVGITASSTDVNGPGVTWSLTGDTSGGGFKINATTGVVSVADPSKIDYETPAGHQYTITAQASDGTLTSSQSFIISVSDVGITTPVDSNAAANTVVEGAANGSTVGITASATDPNGPATTYSLIGDSSLGGFTINASTGVVTVADSTKIDFEGPAGHAYAITVQAQVGATTSTQSFSIAVSDVAPSTPVDSNAAANTVAEGAANGSTVGVTASSTDVNGPGVTYSLTGDTSGGGFTINAATGVVTVADSTKINFETAPGHAYTVTAQASDGTLSSSQTFTIGVSDVAPSTPVDANAAANAVAEGAPNGSTVGITASSTDVNGPGVTYSLVGDTSGGGFTINAATGVVTVADSTKIDYESAPGHAYTVTAQASDGTLSSSQTFTIGVLDVAPSVPTDGDAAANTIAEGAANGSTVGVTAFSTDLNGPAVTYSLIADTSGGGFTINAATGVVTVADSTKLDFESSGGSYTVVAQASDGTLASSQAFVIGVTDVAPTTPVDSNAGANTVAEGAANGSTVGVTASSTDINGPAVTYSLTSDTSGGGFTINAATGVVTVADSSKIDFETAAGHAYTVTAQASDGTQSSTQTFTIGVSDVAPSTPADSNAAANSVTEGAANGSTVGVTASSTDVNGPAVTYSLIGDTSGGGFTINAATGVITVADSSKIDYETSGASHNYLVTAQASDGTLTSQQTFTIDVADVAPSTPVDANAATDTIVEGAANGSTVGITASSTDINGPAVTWSLFSDTSGGGFTINASTGVVTVADSTKVDYETSGGSYTVVAQATDGTLTSSQAFVIAVTDVAPSTPVDSDASANNVTQNAAVGSTVGVTAASTDVNGPGVTYSLLGDTSGGGFTINPTTGVVTVADSSKVIFISNPTTYDVTVQSSDGTLNAQQTFTINVDPNASPIIDSNGAGATAAVSAAENQTAVTTVHATDPDNSPVTPVAYSIVGGDDALKFAIDSGTGVLTFITPPDFENPADTSTAGNNTYIVTVQATDGAAIDQQTITVTVTDVNDAPVITSNGGGATASINVNENSTSVTTVTSTDQDVPAQALTYSLNGGADAGKFSIDPGTGVLTFNTAPNFEVPTDIGGDNGYDVIVRVTDNGVGALHDDQAITVHVQNVNEAPDTAAVTVTSNEDPTGPAYIPITITGSDVDAGDTVASFHITSIPNTGTQGTLYSDIGLTTVVTEGANVTASGNAATLYFVPNANFNTHAGAVTFNAAATDNHGVTDATPATETINVTAVNDGPLNNGVPSSFVTESGFSHIITGLSISDIDANEVGTPTDITTTFTAGAGTVSIGNGTSGGTAGIAGGATITTNGSGTVVLTGSVAQINTTLSGNNVSYTAADNTGSPPSTTTLQMATNDHGHNGTGGAITDTDTINIGVIPQVWFINNAPGAVTDATAPVGSQANPFPDIAAFNASSGPGPNDYIYVKAGTYTGDGINLKDGQTLLGDDQALSFTNPLGGPAIQIEDATGARPTIHVTTAGDQGIDLASGNTVHGINIQTDAGNSGLDDGSGANSVGTLTVSDVAISGAGKAVDLDGGGTLAVTLDSISSTGATADGIDLTGLGGNLTVTGGTTVSNAGTTGIHVQNSAAGATFNFGNTNVTGAGALGVDLTTNAGNVTFADLDINGDVGARSFLASGNTGTITTTSGTIVQNGGSGGVGISGVDATHKTTLNMTLDSINVSNTSTTGVDVAQVSGNLTVGTTTIANNTLVGVQVQTTAAGSTMDFGNTTVSGTHSIAGVRVGNTGNGNAGDVTFDDLDITSTTGPGLVAINNTGTTTVSSGTISTATFPAVTLASNTGGTFNFGGGAGGVDITTTSGTGFSATGGGTVSVAGSGNTIGTTSGTALNLNGVTVGASGVTFDTVTTTSAANGIVIDTVTGGAINVNGGSIAGASSHGVDINNVQNNITIASSITSTAAGNSVEVTNSGKSGGNTITFSGAITDPGHGINLDNNDQNGGVATINFTGALNIDSTTFKGFSATNGGTVSASNAANSITTTTGTALTVTGTTIGASNLVFHDISANGAVNGILLNNTGTSGHLTVTGTGTTDGSGGTITNTTGDAVSLTSTQDVNLNNMNITNSQGTGINGNTVNGVVLNNLTVSGNGNSTAGNGEGNIYFSELTGNASHVTTFDDLTVSNAYVHNVFINNTGGTLTDLVVTDSTFSNNGASTVAGSAFVINLASGGVAGTPTATVHATHNTFSGNLSTPATFTATGFQGSVDDGTLNVHIGDGTAGGLNTFNTNNSGITLSESNTGNLNFDVNNNTVTNNRAVGVAINKFGTGTVTGFFQNNTIGTQGVAGSGAQIGNGLDIHDESTSGTMTLSVTNNIIQSVGGGGLGFEGVNIQQLVGSQNSASVLNITFTGNTIRDIVDDRGLFVNEGNTAGGGMINALISGNTFTNANASGANTTARVGGAPGGTNAVNVTQANAAALAAANGLTASGAPGNTMRVDTNVSFNHAAPPLPPATPQLSAVGQGPGDSHVLTENELAPILAIALQHWIDAGATPEQIEQIKNTHIQIADLPNSGVLANTDANGITIDANAAGWGWFVDQTPGDNSEFHTTTSPTELAANGGAAAAHIDLLTVVEHEMGHVIGLEDSTSPGVMNVALDLGERRLPDSADVALADNFEFAADDTPQVSAAPAPAKAAPPVPVIRGGGQTAAADSHVADAGHGSGTPGGHADAFVFANAPANMPAPAAVAGANLIQGDHFDFSTLRAAIDHITLPPEVTHLIGTLQELVANTIAHDPGLTALTHAIEDGVQKLFAHHDLHL